MLALVRWLSAKRNFYALSEVIYAHKTIKSVGGTANSYNDASQKAMEYVCIY